MQRLTLLALAVVFAVLATGCLDVLASLGITIGPTLSGDAEAAGLTAEEKKREEEAQDLVDLALKPEDKKTEEEQKRTLGHDLEDLEEARKLRKSDPNYDFLIAMLFLDEGDREDTRQQGKRGSEKVAYNHCRRTLGGSCLTTSDMTHRLNDESWQETGRFLDMNARLTVIGKYTPGSMQWNRVNDEYCAMLNLPRNSDVKLIYPTGTCR